MVWKVYMYKHYLPPKLCFSCTLELVPSSTFITLCTLLPVWDRLGVALYGLTCALGREVVGAGVVPNVERWVSPVEAGVTGVSCETAAVTISPLLLTVSGGLTDVGGVVSSICQYETFSDFMQQLIFTLQYTSIYCNVFTFTNWIYTGFFHGCTC